MDRSDRKRQGNTAEDIAWLTTRVRQSESLPQGAVVIARDQPHRHHLLLLSAPDDPAVLGNELYEQTAAGPVPLGVTLAQFAPPPESFDPADLETLPVFRYHPDPVGTGSVRRSPNACTVCGQNRGFEYTAATYGHALKHVCPWCIADGTAAATGVMFVQLAPLIEAGLLEAVVREVVGRTPGFVTVAQELADWSGQPAEGGEVWQACCGDACAFLGPLSPAEMWALPDEVRDEHNLSDDWIEYADEGGGYVFAFRCLHCDRTKIYADFP